MAESLILPSPQEALNCKMCGDFQDIIWNCVTCDGDLCSKCKMKHLSLSISKHHLVISREDAKTRKIYSQEPCSHHPLEKYIMHCDPCRKLVCAKCIAKSHAYHKFSEIKGVEDRMKHQLLEFSHTLKTEVLLKCENESANISSMNAAIQAWFLSAQCEIDKQKTKIKNEVDIQSDHLLAIATAERIQNERKIENAKQKLDAKYGEVKKLTHKVDSMLTLKTSEKLRIIHSLPDISNIHVPETTCFKLSNDWNETRISKDIIGHLHRSWQEQFESKTPQTEELSSQQQPVSPPCKTRQVPQAETTRNRGLHFSNSEEAETHLPFPVSEPKRVFNHVDIEIRSGRKQSIRPDTVVHLSENRVLISKTGTKQIKHTCLEGMEMDITKTNFIIESFVAISSGEILATEWEGRRIVRFSQLGEVLDSISTSDCRPSGICLCKRRQFAVTLSTAGESRLVVYQIEGYQRVLNTRYTNERTGYVQRVAQNANGDFCIVEHRNRAMYVISDNGIIRFSYKGHMCGTQMMMAFKPWDICCRKSGLIFITDMGNKNIHVLDHEGNVINFLRCVDGESGNPRGICIDSSGILWVGDKSGHLFAIRNAI